MILFRQVWRRGRAISDSCSTKSNDTEESIWCFLCEAQLYGPDEARKRFLEVGRDPRPIMREAYNMFKDGGDPEKNEADTVKVHLVASCKSSYGDRR